MKKIFHFFLLFLLGCSTASQLKKYYTPEDKTILELVERIQKSAADKEAQEQLPATYTAVLDKRKALTPASFAALPTAERYLALVKEWSVMQQLFEKISAVPAAAKVVTDLWNPASALDGAKNSAAKEYYNQGLDYMTYDNRQAARNAYDYFKKANDIIPGYQDAAAYMKEALDRATIKVIIRAPNYYNRSWNYWGFQNDWLQQQIISDLNAQSYRDVRFYSDWDANAKRIRPDRIVEMRFTDLYIGQVFTNRNTIQRSKQIQTGSTKSIPSKPVYTTVRATVYVTTRYMQSRAALECRIYDYVSGSNILYDNFPGDDNWRVETATYTGDSRALTQQDLQMINNSGNVPVPTRAQVADKLVRNCYSFLLNRIRSGVQFGY
ncbi:MAG: hypothetical protein QM791_11635 [Ferruginibacter sp.]